MAMGTVGRSTEEFLDEVMSLDGFDLGLTTIDRASSASKGSGVLWEGLELLRCSVGKCF